MRERAYATSVRLGLAAVVCLWLGSTLPSSLAADPRPVTIEWFYTEGCHMCAEVKQLVGDLETQYGDAIDLRRNEISNMDNYKRMMRLERQHGITRAEPMEVFIGSRYLLGYGAILKQLPDVVDDAIVDAMAAGATNSAAVGIPVRAAEDETDAQVGDQDLFAHMRPLAIAGGGLVDGINPCAFATIVFLISVLSMRRVARRRLLAAGLAFAAGVFIAYFLIGLGVLKALMTLSVYRTMSDILYWVVFGFIVMLALLSLHDAWRFSVTGSTRDVVLKLSDRSRQRVHGAVRKIADARSLLSASFAAGLIVSLLEVVCTGQIYLPTIMVMVQHDSSRATGLTYLLLYNTTFIIPLLIVLLLFVYGVKGERFMRFSRRSFASAKVAMALVFFSLAMLLFAGRFWYMP